MAGPLKVCERVDGRREAGVIRVNTRDREGLSRQGDGFIRWVGEVDGDSQRVTGENSFADLNYQLVEVIRFPIKQERDEVNLLTSAGFQQMGGWISGW